MEEPIVTVNRNYQPLIKWGTILALIALVLAVLTVLLMPYYQMYFSSSQVDEDATVLTVEPDVDDMLDGTIIYDHYYLDPETDATIIEPEQYIISSNEYAPYLPNLSVFAVDPSSDTSGVGLLIDEVSNSAVPVTYSGGAENQPLSFLDLGDNTTVNSISADDASVYYGDAYRRSSSGGFGDKETDLDSWFVYYKNAAHGTVIIDNATSPQLVKQGAELWYLKSDGIYRQRIAADGTLQTEEKIPLYDSSYEGLTADNHLAVSPTAAMAAITMPTNNSYELLRLSRVATNVSVLEKDTLRSINTTFSSPVFSPDGQHVALVATYQDNASGPIINLVVDTIADFKRYQETGINITRDQSSSARITTWLPPNSVAGQQ